LQQALKVKCNLSAHVHKILLFFRASIFLAVRFSMNSLITIVFVSDSANVVKVYNTASNLVRFENNVHIYIV
jgi:hypothetical protein